MGRTVRIKDDIQSANNLDTISRFTFFPDENAVGTEIFDYEICDKACPDLCTTATVWLNIGADIDCVAPHLITPNQDGNNDAFIIPCLVNHPGSSIIIYNRWGDEVYRNKDYQNDWAGTYNLSPLPTGTYYYTLEVNDAIGTVLNGYLFLQR